MYNFMSELTGKAERDLGRDLSGRPEGVSDIEWNKILESARSQIIAERSEGRNETAPGQIVENNPGEPILVSVPKESGLDSKIPQAVEKQGDVEELRKIILARALNILNGSHASDEDIDIKKPEGVASFVDKLNFRN